MRERVSRARLGFRVLLVVTLVWAAWPTVASALDGSGNARPAAKDSSTSLSPAATAISSTSTTSSTSTSTTSTTPPDTAPSTSPLTEEVAPVTAPPTAAPPATPPDTAPPAPSPVVAATVSVCDAAGDDLLTAMNRDRQANGVAPLCANGQLNQIARQWAEHLAQTNTFVHQDLGSVITTTPFHAMAENLLRSPGPITIDQMELLWMNSPEHRVNILNGVYVAAGIGIARSAAGVTFAAVEFGGSP